MFAGWSRWGKCQYSAIVYVPVNLSPRWKRTEHDMHRQPTAGFGFCYTDWNPTRSKRSPTSSWRASATKKYVAHSMCLENKQENKIESRLRKCHAAIRLSLKKSCLLWNFGYFAPEVALLCLELHVDGLPLWQEIPVRCFLHSHLQHIWRTCDSAPGGHPPRCPWPRGCFHQ